MWAGPGRRRGRALMVVIVLLAGLVVALLVAQRLSDGPLTDLVPGGPLRAGPLATGRDVDWTALLGGRGACDGDVCGPMEAVELQLVDPPTSRWTGIMVHGGELYVPCDLGFMWARFEGNQRRILNLVYLLKRWHEDAVRDGRVVLRIDGRRFERQAVRVDDPLLEASLRAQLETMARAWVAPEPLGPAPTEEPNDIWFFHIAPRGA